MGARGPRKTPTETLKLRGSKLAKYRADAVVPLFPIEAPPCPTWLSVEAKKEWRRVVKELLAAGVLAKVNRAALAAYCVCWARFSDAEQNVKKTGPVLKSAEGGFFQNPYLSIANAARKEMVKLAAQFGMTPAASSRISPGREDSGKPAGVSVRDRSSGPPPPGSGPLPRDRDDGPPPPAG